MAGGQGGAEDLRDQRAGLGLLALRDGLDRRALLRIGALFDDAHRRAVALVNRSRPGEQRAPAQTVERGLAKVPLIDLEKHVRAAVPVGGKGIELTGTTN